MATPTNPYADLTDDPKILELAERVRVATDAWIDVRVEDFRKRHFDRCEDAANELTEKFNADAQAMVGELDQAYAEITKKLKALKVAVGQGGPNLPKIQKDLKSSLDSHNQAVEEQKKRAEQWALTSGKILRSAILKV